MLTDGQHWCAHDRPDADFSELVQSWMDQAAVGDSFTITLIEMSDAEVEALPDI